MDKSNSLARWPFWLGTGIVLLTHVYMLVAGLTPAQMAGHAVLNLIAVVLLLFCYFQK